MPSKLSGVTARFSQYSSYGHRTGYSFRRRGARSARCGIGRGRRRRGSLATLGIVGSTAVACSGTDLNPKHHCSTTNYCSGLLHPCDRVSENSTWSSNNSGGEGGGSSSNSGGNCSSIGSGGSSSSSSGRGNGSGSRRSSRRRSDYRCSCNNSSSSSSSGNSRKRSSSGCCSSGISGGVSSISVTVSSSNNNGRSNIGQGPLYIEAIRETTATSVAKVRGGGGGGGGGEGGGGSGDEGSLSSTNTTNTLVHKQNKKSRKLNHSSPDNKPLQTLPFPIPKVTIPPTANTNTTITPITSPGNSSYNESTDKNNNNNIFNNNSHNNNSSGAVQHFKNKTHLNNSSPHHNNHSSIPNNNSNTINTSKNISDYNIGGNTFTREMYDTFQSWALQNYGDSGKTKTVTRRKYNRIVRILNGEEIATTENSKFRIWVKAKGFRLGPLDGDCGSDSKMLMVPTRISRNKDATANYCIICENKKHGTISLKPRGNQEPFRTVIENIVQNSNFSIKPAQLLMEFKERTTDQTENEHYPEDKKVKSFYQQLKKKHKYALGH